MLESGHNDRNGNSHQFLLCEEASDPQLKGLTVRIVQSGDLPKLTLSWFLENGREWFRLFGSRLPLYQHITCFNEPEKAQRTKRGNVLN
jgi:hypothetical protein